MVHRRGLSPAHLTDALSSIRELNKQLKHREATTNLSHALPKRSTMFCTALTMCNGTFTVKSSRDSSNKQCVCDGSMLDALIRRAMVCAVARSLYMPMFSTGCRMFSHTGYSCRLCGGRSAFCVASRAVVAYGHLGMAHGGWGRPRLRPTVRKWWQPNRISLRTNCGPSI